MTKTTKSPHTVSAPFSGNKQKKSLPESLRVLLRSAWLDTKRRKNTRHITYGEYQLSHA